MSKLQAIKYDAEKKTLDILDQLSLPHISQYVPVKNVDDGFDAIKTMTVRGAPAIAIVGALSLAVELNSILVAGSETLNSATATAKYIHERLQYLVKARPTAVNLSQATTLLGQIVDDEVATTTVSGKSIIDKVIATAEQMLADDVADNIAIGEHGADWISALYPGKFSVVTICNTGSLATAGYGTALGIIRSLHLRNTLEHVYALETRPYNQGSRLTAYELVHENIPATLISDSMAASLIRAPPRGTSGSDDQKKIKLIVVGADRVAKNGDTANKIGTYQLAVTAQFYKSQGHELKFVVAAPTTSIDLKTASGDAIVIEERPQHELVQIKGPEVIDGKVQTDAPHRTVHVAAPGIDVWNPSFDVTPHELIDAIVTEKGVAVKNDAGNFNLVDL
jgi:methylthioribose-1-phosphate isomerase